MSPSQRLTMRDALIRRLSTRMKRNKKIYFLSADFGSPALDELKTRHKDRFINVGIAEQNLINVAAGLALEGCTVFAYAIAPFLTMRAYEQIRNNLSLLSEIKELNINLVGVGAGLSYDVSGPTHHCLEDIPIMCALPHIMVFSPSDSALTESFTEMALRVKRPKYLRLDGKWLPQIYADGNRADLGSGFCELRRGKRVCIVATGYMTHTALEVARLSSERKRLDPGVIDLFMLKPFDEASLMKRLEKYDRVVTLEEGFIRKGGLGSRLSEMFTSRGSSTRLMSLGFEDRYIFEVGSRQHLHRVNGLSAEGVFESITDFMRRD